MPEMAVATSQKTVLRLLRDVRVERGYKLPQFAAEVGIEKGRLSRIERGIMFATAGELSRVSDALDLPFENRVLPVAEVKP